MKYFLLPFIFLCCLSFQSLAQCGVGEVEVEIDVITDDYGYEAYWQLLPGGNACGTGTIFAGGNMTMNCNSGGLEIQNMSGYGNNTTISEGPWCLNDGSNYDIYLVDDWADGGTKFVVNINSYPVYEFQGVTSDERFSFTASNPPAVEVELKSVLTPLYANAGDITVSGMIKNRGTDTITSLDLAYQLNSGSSVSESLSGLSIAPFSEYYFEHGTPLNLSSSGANDITVTISNFNNGGADANTSDNTITQPITVNPAIPNIIANFLSNNYTVEYQTIGTTTDQLDFPRDLDFHPNGELWVINMNFENTGGSTVTYTNPGEQNQTALWRRDGNAWHFMSLPTGIAFSNNGNFATSTGVFDANHTGGATPFTGPTLWSSDPLIYAQPSGGNGSHMDMLHQSPHCMGIESEGENAFWVMDAHSNDVVRYDFVNDHGPGQHDHSDGIIRRYPEVAVSWISEEIPCHLSFDSAKKWLYVVDGGGQRIVRLDSETGTPGGTPSFVQVEGVAEYSSVSGVTWEVVVNTGLTEPSGIDIIGNTMLVSDHDNGDILVYDISSIPASHVGTITTDATGIMGIVIGPQGNIWYVDADENKVMKASAVPSSVGLSDASNINFSIYPNPSQGEVNVLIPNSFEGTLEVIDVAGKLIETRSITNGSRRLALDNLSQGIYTVSLYSAQGKSVKKLVVR